MRACNETLFLSRDPPSIPMRVLRYSSTAVLIFRQRIKVSSGSVVSPRSQLVSGNWSQVSSHKLLTCTDLFFLSLHCWRAPLPLQAASLVYIFTGKEKEAINYSKGVRRRSTLLSLHGRSHLKQHKLTPIRAESGPQTFYFNYEEISLEAKPNNAYIGLFSPQPFITFLKHVDLNFPSHHSSETHTTECFIFNLCAINTTT